MLAENTLTDFPEIHGSIRLNEPMSVHTSYRIGGPADVFAVVEDSSDLQVILRWAADKGMPSLIVGAGTNLLVSDKGIRGLVVKFGAGFGKVHVCEDKVFAGAAVRLPILVKSTLAQCLSGLEGLAGIPGTVGGAVVMNAGTPVGCVKDALVSVKALDADLCLCEISADTLGLRYRGSTVLSQELVILEATFALKVADETSIRQAVDLILSKRKAAQPVEVHTAGSVFKNPPDGFAGQMLEAVGAKGMQVGGARVSTKHANFIVNSGDASAMDVKSLILELRRLVNDRFGVMLEPEIAFVGEW